MATFYSVYISFIEACLVVKRDSDCDELNPVYISVPRWRASLPAELHTDAVDRPTGNSASRAYLSRAAKKTFNPQDNTQRVRQVSPAALHIKMLETRWRWGSTAARRNPHTTRTAYRSARNLDEQHSPHHQHCQPQQQNLKLELPPVSPNTVTETARFQTIP